MGHLRNFIRSITPNPFLSILKKLPQDAKIAFFWNRGLGDIPLELFALIKTVFEYCEDAKITIITRADLYQGFTLLDPKITIYSSRYLKRKACEDYDKIFDELTLDKNSFNHIFYKPDPAYWVQKQKKGLKIQLRWDKSFFKPFLLNTDQPKAFLHIHSETVYGFEKNLPQATWHDIIKQLKQKSYYTIALGFAKKDSFDVDCDLRGDTDLYQILTMMQEGSCLFIGPDSGLLNMLYYLDVQINMHLISFWANTDVGLLKQGSSSPNRHLKHDLVIAKKQDLSQLEASQITCFATNYTALSLLYHKTIPPHIPLLNEPFLLTYKKLIQVSSEDEISLDNMQNPPCNDITPPFALSDKLCPIILAGGHGSRLDFHLPKALFTVNGKTLLEYVIDKILKAQKVLNTCLDVILIVSKEGYLPILHFLKTHQFFGLTQNKFHIVIQKDLPFLTLDHKLVMKDATNIWAGPNGNGEIFTLLDEHKIFDLIDQNIEGFEIIPIDNPLAPLFLKNHEEAFLQNYDVSMLSIQTQNGDEKLGKVCLHKEGISIIEYTQNPPSHLTIANTGLLAFKKTFAFSLAHKHLPLHPVLKNYKCFNGKDYEILKLKKFETFIFDNLKWAKNIKIFTTSRSYIFQPLKEKIGPYGIEALEKALNMVNEKLAVVAQGDL